jgi:carbon storage regulator
MLVLSRKSGQKVFVGAEVAITVLEVRGNRVRLGVEAPAGLVVLRAELASERADAASGGIVPTASSPVGLLVPEG